MTPQKRRRLLSFAATTRCLVVLGGALGCSSDAITLPAGYNDLTIKPIRIDGATTHGRVARLAGVNGGPAAMLAENKSLYQPFGFAGIDLIRIPEGYVYSPTPDSTGCDATLAGIFPNPNADPDAPASYHFAALDRILGEAAPYSLLGSVAGEPFSGTPLSFQAIFDIGLTTCVVDPDTGVQTGQKIANIDTWTKVVVNVLRHANKTLLTDSSPMKDGAVDGNMRHIEFISDPLGRGNYPTVAAVAADYLAFGNAIRAAFPSVDGVPVIRLVSPSFSVGSPSDVAGTVQAFLDQMKTQNALDRVDVVAYETRASSPLVNQQIAQAVRDAIEGVDAAWANPLGAGLGGRTVWLARYEPGAEAVTPLATSGLVQDLPLRRWSNATGTFAIGTQIALQGLVEGAAIWRADRRTRALDGNTDRMEESPLWRKDGEQLPAALHFQAMKIFADAKQTRLEVAPAALADRDTLWTMATLETDHPCQDGEGTCPRLRVIVANSNTDTATNTVDYQFSLGGIVAVGDDERLVAVRRLTLDESNQGQSEAKTLGDGAVEQQPPENVPLVGGSISYRMTVSSPSIEYLLIDLGRAPDPGFLGGGNP